MSAQEIYVPVKSDREINAICVGVKYYKERGGIVLCLHPVACENGSVSFMIGDRAYRSSYILMESSTRLNRKKLADYQDRVRDAIARHVNLWWDHVVNFAAMSNLTILEPEAALITVEV